MLKQLNRQRTAALCASMAGGRAPRYDTLATQFESAVAIAAIMGMPRLSLALRQPVCLPLAHARAIL